MSKFPKVYNSFITQNCHNYEDKHKPAPRRLSLQIVVAQNINKIELKIVQLSYQFEFKDRPGQDY